MLVNVFGGEIREGKNKMWGSNDNLFAGERYEITVTAGACIPVTDIFVRREGDQFEEAVTE